MTQEELQKMLDEIPHKKFAKLSDRKLQQIEILSQTMRGENNPFSGKKHSQDSLKKIGEHTKCRSNGMTGKKHSNKTKELIALKSKNQDRDKFTKSVLCFLYSDKTFIKEYSSLTIACNELNLNKECARLTCVGKRNHTGGYYFKYK